MENIKNNKEDKEARDENQTSLYLVPTPIGNLGDITLRALETLKKVDLILAEDTRKTGVLLKHYEIKQPLQSYHAHNEHFTVQKWVEQMQQGYVFALVSDAGTPAISDPGFLLVRAALKANLKLECLTGATAFVPALVKSGLPSERFCFEGFLPHKKGRKTHLDSLAEEKRTFILYESPHRLIKTLTQLAEVCGNDRNASVSRELTKVYEETKNGTLEEIINYFSTEGTIKGEFVIVVEGKTKPAKSVNSNQL
jgi:16S rRNA (cytidine1402-2'-O)-methyltransferase